MNEEALQLQFNVENIVRELANVDYLKLSVIAVQLGLESEISEIEDERVPYQRRLCLAQKWLRKRQDGANWEALSSALCHPEVGEMTLARRIEDRYMRRGSSTSTVSSTRSQTPMSPGPLSPPLNAIRDLRTKEKVSKTMREATERDAMESFSHLVTFVGTKLSQKEVDVGEFRSYLTIFLQQPSLPVAIPDTTDILTIIESVSEQKLWSYDNYGDIERIANRYLRKDREVCKEIDDHRDMVNNFLATKLIADHIEVKIPQELRTLKKDSSIGVKRNTKNYYNLLSLKLHDVNVERKTLAYVRCLWGKLKREFSLPDCYAVLDHIIKSCVEIVWIIPSSVGKDLERTHPWSAIHFLQQESASRMVLNEAFCIYDKEDSMKLLRLTSEGDFEEVSWLLQSEEKGAAVNATFAEILEGKSALIIASEKGHELVMFVLLDSNADVNFKLEASGRSALFYAAENGHDTAVTILLAYGADPQQTDENGETAYAVAKKLSDNEKVLEELQKRDSKKRAAVKSITTTQRISEGIEDVRVTMLRPFHRAYEQWSADLVRAARNDHLDIVKHIINNNKSDVNARESDRHGWNPLMWATENGNVDMVDFLLEKEANPNLASKDSKWTPLQLASRRGHFKIAKILLDSRADPNAQTIEGLTALAIAAYENRTAIAMLLIYRGADIHIREHSGWSPLIRASNEGNLKLMKLISDRGAYPNDQTEEGWSPLMVSSHYGHIDVVKELIRRGAHLDLTTDAGDTALHIASVEDHANVVNELARHGANLNIINMDGLTALMVAVNKGYSAVVDVLLEYHADVNREHKNTGWTAIFMAAKNDRVEILKQLLLHGANSELADGTTLLDVASHLKQMQIIDALGTSVDKGKSPLKADTRFQDNFISLDSLVKSLEERLRGLVKGYL